MRTRVLVGWTFVLVLLSSNIASAKDLFRQLDPETEVAVTEYNSRFIAERLYFAKQHRVVELDHAALKKSSIGSLPLFSGDEQISISRKRLDEGPIHGTARWVGNIVLPPDVANESHWSKAAIQEIKKSGLTFEEVLSEISQVDLLVLYWDIDTRTGEAFPSFGRFLPFSISLMQTFERQVLEKAAA